MKELVQTYAKFLDGVEYGKETARLKPALNDDRRWAFEEEREACMMSDFARMKTLKRQAMQCRERIALLAALAEGVGSPVIGERVQATPNADRMARHAELLEEETTRLFALVSEMYALIDSIEDDRTRMMAELYYVQGRSQSKIAEHCGYERSRVSQILCGR